MRRIFVSFCATALLAGLSSAGCGNSSTDEQDDAGGGTGGNTGDSGPVATSEGGATSGDGGQGSGACSSANVVLSPAQLVPVTALSPSGPVGIAVGDVNKDGKLDLATVGSVGTAINLGTGNNAFGPSTAIGGGGNNGGGNNLVIVDFDGDTWPDLVSFGSSIAYLPNTADGSGSFGARKTIIDGGAIQGVVADFNGDGVPDIAATSNQLVVALGSGKGVFNGTGTIYGGSAAWSNVYGDTGNSATGMVASDVDSDGAPDLVFSSNTAASLGNAADGGLCISLNKGHGSMFADPVCYPVISGFDPLALAVADLNGDGAPDAVLGGSGNSTTLNVFLNKNDKTGAFKSPVANAADTSTAANDIVTADVNNDGKLDIVAFYTYGGVTVVSGNGDGTFASTGSSYPVGDAQSSVAALATGAFDSSGLVGIAVLDNVNTTTAAPYGGVDILAGTCAK
jgi:hypothetical protein